jgi:sodium transport system permease protein
MMVFAVTVQIIIATITRSFKETQTYLGLLPLIPSVPGMVLVFVAVAPNLWMMTIPFFSQVVLIGQLVRGDPVSMANVAMSVGSTLLLSVAMLFLAGWLYSREQLLFSA